MIWLIISILVAAIDQASKRVILDSLETGDRIPVINGLFYITLHRNPGAAWGIFRDGRVFFLAMIPIIAAVVAFFMFKSRSRFLRFALSLILGGAAGNYIDRIAWGKVTDFLLFYIGPYEFPVFNAADIAITCGTILLAVFIFFICKEPGGKAPENKRDEKRDELKYE